MRYYGGREQFRPLFCFYGEHNMTYQTNAFAHGIGNSAVSSQWFSRPDDQKFLSLDNMLAFKRTTRSE